MPGRATTTLFQRQPMALSGSLPSMHTIRQQLRAVRFSCSHAGHVIYACASIPAPTAAPP